MLGFVAKQTTSGGGRFGQAGGGGRRRRAATPAVVLAHGGGDAVPSKTRGAGAHLAVLGTVFHRRSTDGVRGERGAGSGSLVNNPKFKTQFCNFNFSPSCWPQIKKC